MSEPPSPRRVLKLIVAGPGQSRLMADLVPSKDVEVFVLSEASAREALEKIFAADSVSVWGEL